MVIQKEFLYTSLNFEKKIDIYFLKNVPPFKEQIKRFWKKKLF